MQSNIPNAVSLEQLNHMLVNKQAPTVELTTDSYIDAGYDMLEQLPNDWKTIHHLNALAFTLINHIGMMYEDMAEKCVEDHNVDGALHCAAKSGQFSSILTALAKATNV